MIDPLSHFGPLVLTPQSPVFDVSLHNLGVYSRNPGAKCMSTCDINCDVDLGALMTSGCRDVLGAGAWVDTSGLGGNLARSLDLCKQLGPRSAERRSSTDARMSTWARYREKEPKTKWVGSTKRLSRWPQGLETVQFAMKCPLDVPLLSYCIYDMKKVSVIPQLVRISR